MNRIKRVYLGLPKSLVDAVLWVSREFRTHPLSHEPGGSDVVVEYHSGRALGYDWIKYPSRYIAKIFSKDISNEYEEFEEFGEEEQLSIIKMKIARIFARQYESEEYEKVAFELVWDSETSNVLPWTLLEEYDYKNMLELEASSTSEIFDEVLTLEETVEFMTLKYKEKPTVAS